MKKRYIGIIFFILLFPFMLFWGHYKTTDHYVSFSIIPKIEQPRDTLIANEAIPLHHWKTKQDTPVYFVPTDKLQIIDIIITFDAGSSRDGDKYGLSNFHTAMLEEGTEHRSSLEIAQAFENVGAIFDTSTERDRVSLQLRSIVDPNTLLSTIDLFTEILSKPSFSDIALQQIKNQSLVALKNELQLPNMKAITAFYQASYGKHPYGHLVIGTQDGIAQISRQDLLDFHKQYFVARNAIITIVGGIHRDEAMIISERITAALPKGKTAPPIAEVRALKEASNIHITLPLQQTHVLLGQPCCTKNESDYFSLIVGNYILGDGPFVARLFKEIREKRGLVYSVNSSFRFLKQPGPFMITLQTKAAQAKETEALVKATLKDFIENGPTEEEVMAAKKGIIGAFPLGISNNAQIANVVSEMTFYDLPNDFLDSYRSNVEKVTSQDIKTAFQKRLDPDKMVLVVVGE